jgi:hypothetical protein
VGRAAVANHANGWGLGSNVIGHTLSSADKKNLFIQVFLKTWLNTFSFFLLSRCPENTTSPYEHPE